MPSNIPTNTKPKQDSDSALREQLPNSYRTRSMEPTLPQKPKAPPSQVVDDFNIDDIEGEVTALETLEDLYASPNTDRLRDINGEICDSHGQPIIRIGEQV
jgi:hypothetical protein